MTFLRQVISTYCVEVRKFLLRILDLIREGLGLKLGYFEDDLSKIQLLSVNYHIPCPDPSLTLGMPEHCDPNLISMLHQCAVPGLQVFKDGQWLGVEPLPDALIVIPGLQLKVYAYLYTVLKMPNSSSNLSCLNSYSCLNHIVTDRYPSLFKMVQVISNDLFTSPVHRVMTHAKEARTTIGTFLIPSTDISIEPAIPLVDTGNAPVYRAFTYKEFFTTFTGKGCDAENALKCFKKTLE